jgi:hypothetical protein
MEELIMKKTLGILLGLLIVANLGFGVFAGTEVLSPAEIYSKVAGISVEEAYELKGDMTFGQLAEKNGFADEFVTLNKENMKALVEQRYAEGKITAEQKESILERMENCDGNNLGKERGNFGLQRGMGQGNGRGRGQGPRDGSGQGRGNGQGFGPKDGSGQGRSW